MLDPTWEEMFRWLKERGLSGVCLVIRDAHGGLVKAVHKHFQGATRQRRCQVHLLRSVLGHCGRRVRAEAATAAKQVLRASER